MDYAPMGSLRNNLYSIAQMEWKKKLNLLLCIASDLQIIHSQNLIHRDLHSGNILQDNLYSAYIADLGLSISLDIALKKETGGVCGVLPYIAPEVLCGNPYIFESDIYSFGIIMWEIFSGAAVPFNHSSHSSRLQFQFQVCNGLRPPTMEGTPQCYMDLMKRCWDENPENRPSAVKIEEIFTEWQNDERILSELTKSNDRILLELKRKKEKKRQTVYKSEFIPYTTKSSYQGK
jgi:serine/threonine protein kinase